MARFIWLMPAMVVTTLLLSRSAFGQQTARPYDGIQAGFDAYQLGEEKRQINLGQQLYLNDRMRALATPLATYGYGYGPYLSTDGYAPVSRGYAYAYGNSSQRYYSGYALGFVGQPLTVFEPWPYVPGDIWGDFYMPPLRQPVAQVQSQTGPNRWESHPFDARSPQTFSVMPPMNSSTLDTTPYATERPEGPAVPSIRRTPNPEPPAPGPSVEDRPKSPRRRVF